MKIPLYINLEPELYMDITEKTTILSIKEFLKKYKPEKIQFFVNDKTESKIFDTDKYDKYDLSSIWSKMKKPAIKITVKSKKKVKFTDDVKISKGIKAKFTMDATFFKYLLTVFGNYKTLIPLNLEGNILKVFDTDSSFVSLLSAYIPVDIEYQKERKIDYGIQPVEMKKFIGTKIKDKEITFTGTENGYSLKMDNEEKTWKTMMYDEEYLGIPYIDYTSEVTVSSKDLYQILKEKKKEKKSVSLEVKNNKFYIDNELFTSSDIKSSKNINKKFNIKLLENLSKTQNSQYSPEVTLYFSEETPLKMTYYLSRKSKYDKKKKTSVGYISYFVAPLFDEEEL